MVLSNFLNEIVKKSFEENGYDVEGKIVRNSDRPDLSHYQCNSAFEIAKKEKKNPKEVAEKIVETLKKDSTFEEVFVAGPGFINLVLSNEFLTKNVEELLNDDNLGIEKLPKKRLILDYGGANVAKPLHVGHLRSAIIGEGLKRLAKTVGYEVIGDVHLGDWGRQMGIIICEIKRRYPDLVYFDNSFEGQYPVEAPVTINELDEIYPTASAKAKEDEELMEEARKATAILQTDGVEGHRGYYALWKHLVKISIEDLKKNYDRLNVTFDLWRGESDCNKSIPEMMEYLHGKNLVQESEGALIIDVSEETDKTPLPPVILKTKSMSVGYQTTELATIYERIAEFKPDEIWYVTDVRQDTHFKQVFRAAYKSGIVSKDVVLDFFGFGTMNGKDGKPFKTRDGGVMKLADLLNLVQDVTRKKLDENVNDFTDSEKEKISFQIADATVKYADALSNRATDYVFDIEKFTEMQGKTGPYILYSTVRINSLLKKANVDKNKLGKLLLAESKEEKDLMLNILKMPDAIKQAFDNKSLTEIVDYLYELNSSYNNFYNVNRVLTQENADKKQSWLQLSSAVAKINKKLLDIMVIEIPEKM